AGGGWAPGNYTEDKKSTGSALLGTGGVGSDGGGVGGLACYKSRGNTKGFGGFGGGGGGCVAGGGGGGFTGGRAWSNSQTNGEGGWSYLPDNQHVFYRAVYPGSNYKSGSVYIIPAIVGCGCAYLCAATNQLRSSVVCICPADFKLGPDGKSCIYQSTETTKIIFLITGSVFAVVIICLILGIWMYRSYRKRKERKENINIIHNGILNYDPISRNRNGNVDINPTYDFNGRILTTNDLPRILRDELRIQKSIGEGAFGVVYRGYYKKTGETEEMRVAIKVNILDYTPPVIGRPAAPLPYRATHPLDENAPPDGVLRAVDVVNSSGAINEPQPYKSQEEPQYVTPLPADDFFEGVDAELMKDAERFGRFRRSNEMAPLDDMRDYCDDDDDDDDNDDDSVGDEEDEDEDAINVAEADAEDEAEDDDDDDNDEQNVEEEEDDDANGAEIVLDADNNRFDEDDDDAYGDNARSNGPVSSYHWNRFKETSFISMKEPNTKQTNADGQISSSKRRKSFSELEDNRPNPYSLTGRVRYNVASDGKIRC
ncbi:hypothetical protein AGLY_006731, partial [Aphis glycines]